MEVLCQCCAGLDVHKATVEVTVRRTEGAGRRPQTETRRFGTMTGELLAMGDWLAERGVTHIAM